MSKLPYTSARFWVGSLDVFGAFGSGASGWASGWGLGVGDAAAFLLGGVGVADVVARGPAMPGLAGWCNGLD